VLSSVKRYFGTRSSAGARRIALFYALFAGAWILISDYFVGLLSGHDFRFELSQTLKGLLFVAGTAMLLFMAARRQLQRLQRESVLRERAEANVAENERLFRQLFDANPLPTWLFDRETLRFLEVNEAAEHQYGYTRAEFTDLRLPDLEEPIDAGVQPASLTSSAGSRPLRACHRTKEGQRLQVEIQLAELTYARRSCVVAVVSDITARTKAEDELRASEEKFREIAETIQEVFWVFDPREHRIVYVSPAYERIWGRKCEALYLSSKDWLEAVHAEDRERVSLASDNHTTQPYDVEYRIVRPDGTVRWIADHGFPVRDAAGQVLRIVGVADDITARKRSEAEHTRLEAQFRQAQKMEAVGQLSAGISHDFNNLLTIIQMQTALLLAEPDRTPDDAMALREIEQATKRAADLTRQLLAFSRRQKLTRQDIDLNDVIEKATRMLGRTVGQNIELQTSRIPQPLEMCADPGMLEQVVVNLVINARDSMPRGGLLSVRTSLAEFDAENVISTNGRIGRFACIAVTDVGCGIRAEHLPRIFEPFFTTKDVGKGSGLGLAMVYGIVEQHRGWIDVETVPGKGSTFRVYLPIGEEQAKQRPSLPAMPSRFATGTILLLEDDENIRRVVANYLTHQGYHLIVAGSGHDALAKWQEHRNEIDLLFTDLVLPGGMDGRELARFILKDRPELPVIYTSGFSAHLGEGESKFVDGENFLMKPFDPQRLAEIIHRKLTSASPGRSC
jgi:PAS domain S-box-containing protein